MTDDTLAWLRELDAKASEDWSLGGPIDLVCGEPSFLVATLHTTHEPDAQLASLARRVLPLAVALRQSAVAMEHHAENLRAENVSVLLEAGDLQMEASKARHALDAPAASGDAMSTLEGEG